MRMFWWITSPLPGRECERLDWVVRSVEGEHLLIIGKGGRQRVSKGFTLLGGSPCVRTSLRASHRHQYS